jgi:hypothetical protein
MRRREVAVLLAWAVAGLSGCGGGGTVLGGPYGPGASTPPTLVGGVAELRPTTVALSPTEQAQATAAVILAEAQTTAPVAAAGVPDPSQPETAALPTAPSAPTTADNGGFQVPGISLPTLAETVSQTAAVLATAGLALVETDPAAGLPGALPPELPTALRPYVPFGTTVPGLTPF